MISRLARSVLPLCRNYATTIGIDLGTTNSCVAISEGGDVVVIENLEGSRTTPSCVAFDPQSGATIIGDHAKRQSVINPKNTFYATKRLIGRPYNDPAVQKDLEITSFDIVPHENGDAWVKCEMNGESYSPTQIAAFILTKMKETAENYLGHEVTEAVVTVPAYFNDSQKRATKDAGVIAGLNVKRIINEPTAAALGFGLGEGNNEGVVAVFDLGGGTFDISILEILEDETGNIFEVLSTNGDTHLGGEDFDQVLVDMILDEFESMEGINLRGEAVAIQRVREEAEKAKKSLDHVEEFNVQIPFIVMGDDPKNMDVTVKRHEYETKCEPYIQRAMEPCKLALSDCGLDTKDVDHVLLVGGMTRMPLVQQQVMNFFGKKPSKSVNPDECVAIGAAIQGAILDREVEGILLVDITPLSLGIETVGDVFSRIIPRNSTIPIKRSEEYTTTEDNQTTLHVKVFQGEREVASKNKLLGDFVLQDVPAAPRGVPKINVSFEIDANGIINVEAQDQASGKKNQIIVESGSGLSDEEIEQMVRDAEIFREKDLLHKKLGENKNEAERLIDETKKGMNELNDLLEEDVRMDAEAAIKNVEMSLEFVKNIMVDHLTDTEVQNLTNDIDQLRAIQLKISERVYLMKSGKDGQSNNNDDDDDDDL